MTDAEIEVWADSLEPNELRGQVIGLMKRDAHHKQKIYRQERNLLGMLDKNGKLRYELDRLENVLVDCYKKPEHVRPIVQRAIPKRIYKETL